MPQTPQTSPKILVTGATGQLGRRVIAELLDKIPASRIVALARRAESAQDLAARGILVRQGDYGDPATLDAAFAGIDRVLLISSNEVGRRAAQHGNAIEAARRAGVGLVAYTSILFADASPMALAAEHRETEEMLRASGLPFVLLRNGWYHENYTGTTAAVLEHGALFGSSGDGRISSAARADYAAAAAAVLLSEENLAGRVFELAGDHSFTLADLAAEIASAAGKPVAYRDLPEAEYRQLLEGAGLPAPFAAVLADSSYQASRGFLFDESRQLSTLIGRPTTPLAQAVRDAVGSVAAAA